MWRYFRKTETHIIHETKQSKKEKLKIRVKCVRVCVCLYSRRKEKGSNLSCLNHLRQPADERTGPNRTEVNTFSQFGVLFLFHLSFQPWWPMFYVLKSLNWMNESLCHFSVCVRVREWWIYVLCVGANSILKCNSHNSKVKHVKWKRENSMFIVFCVCATFKCYACACACAGCVCKLLILNFSFANVLFCFIA